VAQTDGRTSYLVGESTLHGGRERFLSPTPAPSQATDPAYRPRHTASTSGYLPTLDGWRGVAILLVVSAHGREALLPTSTLYGAVVGWFGGLGSHGVELFFAVSGLLICHNLTVEKAAHGRLDLRTFYARRLLRLLPAAGLFLIVAYGSSLAGLITVYDGELPAALLCYRNYYSAVGEGGWYTGHFWSLSVEEHFYLALPWLIAFGRRKTMLAVLPMLALTIAVWRAVDFRYGVSAAAFPGLNFSLLRTDLCLDHLAWGALFGLLLAAPVSRRAISGIAHPVVRACLIGLLLADLVYLLPARNAWIALVTPAVLAGTILAPGSLVGRMLENRLLTWVGRLSYSLYLWQQLYLIAVVGNHPEEAAAWPLGLVQNFPLGLTAAFATAAASYYLVVQPVRRWGYEWIQRSIVRKLRTAPASAGSSQ
jgi:peptidoglycan/LPS O-acetylase OafA/YrhL